MKEEIKELSQRVMKLIPQYVVQGDAPAIAKLTAAAKEIKTLQLMAGQLEEGLKRNQALLDHYTRDFSPVLSPAPARRRKEVPGSVRPPAEQRLRIEIDWGRAGKGAGREVICEHMAADTMAKLVLRLAEEMGRSTLAKLARVQISRGPMVSTNPGQDFVNRANQSNYAYQSLGDSGYYILTESSTSEKVADVKKALKELNFPPGAFLVQAN
jgi:hypothetical protein